MADEKNRDRGYRDARDEENTVIDGTSTKPLRDAKIEGKRTLGKIQARLALPMGVSGRRDFGFNGGADPH